MEGLRGRGVGSLCYSGFLGVGGFYVHDNKVGDEGETVYRYCI